jgi:spermidine synthase
LSTPIIILLVLSVLSWVLWLSFPALLKRRGVVFERTKFGITLIFDSADQDKTPIRLLSVNGVFQSVCYTQKDLLWEPVCTYHRAFADALQGANLHRALVIGGGGYSFPKYMMAHTTRMRLDVVEIDPAITRLAKKYFYLDELIAQFCREDPRCPRLDEKNLHSEAPSQKVALPAPGCTREQAGRLGLIEGDGWSFLAAQPDGSYDCIINDAFSGKKPLGPMATDEGARLVHDKLSCGGYYLANIRSSLCGRNARGLTSCKEAFGACFKHLYLVCDKPDEPHKVGYNAFIATDKPLDCLRFGGTELT